MTLRDVLLACGNLKNKSQVIITDEHSEVYSNTVDGCFEQNPTYMKMEVCFSKSSIARTGTKSFV